MEILEQADKHHQSMATSITRERLMAMNRKSRNKFSLKITDLTDNSGNPCGTKVVIEQPL